MAVGDDVVITPTSISVSGSIVTMDLGGVTLENDDYQFTLVGTGGNPIVTDDGVTLDGDHDGTDGGDFVSTFTLAVAPTFTSIQDNIFTPSCALSGCHAGPAPAQGMNLSVGQAYANIVNITALQGGGSFIRIIPGDPDNSYLVQKVEGTAGGARMPFGAPPLSTALIQDLRDWVSDGAPNN